MFKTDKRKVLESAQCIIAKLWGVSAILYSLGTLKALYFPAKEAYVNHSVLPIANNIIENIWELSIVWGVLGLGAALLIVNPVTQPGIRRILKYFGLLIALVSPLMLFSWWIGCLAGVIFGGVTYWLFRDASIKAMFRENVAEYEKNLSQDHPRLNKIRRFLSKIVLGFFILFLIFLAVILLVAIALR